MKSECIFLLIQIGYSYKSFSSVLWCANGMKILRDVMKWIPGNSAELPIIQWFINRCCNLPGRIMCMTSILWCRHRQGRERAIHMKRSKTPRRFREGESAEIILTEWVGYKRNGKGLNDEPLKEIVCKKQRVW